MSPEQKENSLNVTYASDIYSLGVIAYELIIGKLSYGTINLSLLPPNLRKIIAKALAISIEERYNDIVELITDISQYLKSGEWEKERPGSDQIKEIQEQIQKTENTLSSPLPSWDFLDFGLAKAKGPWTPGLYYDFFRLPNNLYLFLIASSSSSSVESSIHIANLRGMIHMLIHEKITSPKTPFASVPFVTTLNQQICEDRTNQHFHLSLLVLDPLRDQLAFLTCGLGPLIHLPEGTAKPRILGLPHLSLGTDPLATFSLTTDNWYTGDILFFHSLPGSAFGTDLEKKFLDAISENAFISPQHQSEAIFKKMNGYPSFSNLNHPKILFSINRIS
jgi:serine/threonine protein kinase